MINIILYDLSKSFYQFEPGKDTVYVAPGPALADALRSNLNNPDVEVTTMAQFLLGLLKEYLGKAKSKENYKSKSQLLLTLGLAWRQIEAGNYAQFKNAFMLLTDLRGYTQDDVLLESLLEEFDPTLGQIVLKMNALMKNLEIMDEHAAYWLLSQCYENEIWENEQKNFCFWGFDFLSPVQVDFIKVFSKFNNVFIPLPKNVYSNSIQSDWVHWIDEEAKVLELDEIDKKCHAKIKTFPKGYLSRSIKENLQDNVETDIYLTTRNISAQEIQAVSSSAHFYKVSLPVFKDRLSGVDKLLKSNLTGKAKLNHAEFDQLLEKYKKISLTKKDYISFKIYEIYEKVKTNWSELTSSEFEFDWFISELMQEIVSLDLPRLSLIPAQEKSNGRILSLMDLNSLNHEVNNYICITSDFVGNQSSSSLYSNTTETKLLQIGPLRRNALEELFTIAKLQEVLTLKSTTVLLENGVLEKSQLWHDLLGSNETEKSDLKFSKNKILPIAGVNVAKEFELLEVTPSKLQSFLNCPRKFFHDYLDGLFPRVKLQRYLSPVNSGELAHKIIETYIKSEKRIESDFDAHLEKHLHSFYENNTISPDLDVHYEYIVQLRLKTLPVTDSLLKLKEQTGAKFEFEKKMDISDGKILRKGRCDLFIDGDDFQMLIDFKSSSYGIPDMNWLLRMDNLQMWFYLNLFQGSGLLDPKKSLYCGFVNLSQPEKSLLLKYGESDEKIDISQIPFMSKYKSAPISLLEQLEKYKELENQIISSINNEKSFLPTPLSTDVCTYCALRVICPKAEEGRDYV